MNYFIDTQGNYLGGWDTNSPGSALEVPFPPLDARQKWNGEDWGPIPKSKSELIQENNSAYEAATTALTADYPQLEKDTWSTQDEETKLWISDPENASTPWIDTASSERGIDREEYLRRTLVKSRQFKLLSSLLTGRRQKYEDEIKNDQVPVFDYTLTTEILIQLQQIAQDGMNLPSDQLKGVLL